jgi:pimeloyl-ACP methyl ester carboxylesterase
VVTGHHRLLDPLDIRLAVGDFEQCRVVFERHREEHKIRERGRHLVLLLHGIFRSKDSFNPMAVALRKHGYSAYPVNYPSTRQSLEAHAEQIEGLLDRVDWAEQVSLVGHSMGGMVARVLLSRPGAWRERMDFHRLVMIATPNRGAKMIERLEGVSAFRQVAGPCADQMHPERASEVPIPSVRFGTIAGVRGDGKGFNPFLEGEDDMTVRADATRLEGAEDHHQVPAVHTFIMSKPVVIQSTIRYLKTGRFGADA